MAIALVVIVGAAAPDGERANMLDLRQAHPNPSPFTPLAASLVWIV
jgi:hypothetical protein